jgi:hypothetical protein
MPLHSALTGAACTVNQPTHRHLALCAKHPVIPLPAYNAVYLPLAVPVEHDVKGDARLDERELGELCAIVDGEYGGADSWGEEEEEGEEGYPHGVRGVLSGE